MPGNCNQAWGTGSTHDAPRRPPKGAGLRYTASVHSDSMHPRTGRYCTYRARCITAQFLLEGRGAQSAQGCSGHSIAVEQCALAIKYGNGSMSVVPLQWAEVPALPVPYPTDRPDGADWEESPGGTHNCTILRRRGMAQVLH